MTKDKALKMALEALENGKRVRAFEGGTKFQEPLEDAAITAIKAALVTKDVSLPEQEPMVTKGEKGLTLHVGWDDLPAGTRLFTSPPQRQPLRGEQIYELFVKTLPKLTLGMTYVPEWAIPIARAIEAAHGIGDKT